jgi:hypothetical protein
MSYNPYLDTRDLYTEREELLRLSEESAEGGSWSEDEDERLLALNELFGAIGEGDALDGTTMIPESMFVEYAQDYAEDITDMRDHSWPFCHIDWQAAADNLRQDYTEVDFDGTTYLIRL